MAVLSCGGGAGLLHVVEAEAPVPDVGRRARALPRVRVHAHHERLAVAWSRGKTMVNKGVSTNLNKSGKQSEADSGREELGIAVESSVSRWSRPKF